jgi:synaptobrevin homolog YKT6
MPELKEYLTKYQDPQQADSIMKIQKELDETKIVLHKTIESVLQRGEKLDDLVAKSDGLSAQSKMFYRMSRPWLSAATTFPPAVRPSCH